MTERLQSIMQVPELQLERCVALQTKAQKRVLQQPTKAWLALCTWRWTGAPVTVSTIWTVRAMLLASRSSLSNPSGGPVAMNTVLGFRYLIFKLLFPRICMRHAGVIRDFDFQALVT